MEVRRVRCEKAGESDVSGDGGGEDTEGTTGFGDVDLAREEAAEEEEEGEVKEEEEGGEGDGRPQTGDEEDKGDDEPGRQVDTKSRVELFNPCSISLDNAKLRNVENGERDPESSVRRESGSTKCVTGGKLPHTGQELAKTSVPKGHSENDVGSVDSSCLNVEQGEHEGSCAECQQTERRRVGELSVEDGEGRLRVVDGVSTGSDEPSD